jgi:hypothetical protein
MEEMMRSIVAIVLLLVSLFGMAYAQNSPIDKGSKIVGGGLSFLSLGEGDYKRNIIEFNPSFGVFVKPGLFLGGTLLYSRDSFNDYVTTSYGIGPNLRYYFGGNNTRNDVKETFYPYLKTDFLYYKTITDYNNDMIWEDYSYKYNHFNWNIGGGVQLMFSNTVGGYAELAVGAYNSKYNDYTWSTERKIAFVIGFSYFLY